MSDDSVLTVEREGAVATVTLDRPRVRNALNARLRRELRTTLGALDEAGDVRAIVLTGADPAFCAGLDLTELAQEGASGLGGDIFAEDRGPFPSMSTPVVGAVNGAAITGGFEIALACDFLVASEHARFADTHARVGIMPGWGLTVLLPEAVGYRRALEMSTTGNFVDAQTAFDWGLVNHVVPHERLLSTAVGLAQDIAGNDPDGVAEIRATYRLGSRTTRAEAWVLEAERSAAWLNRHDTSDLADRRAQVIERGRTQNLTMPDGPA